VSVREPQAVRDVVGRMARALDADDLQSAALLLSDDCVYEAGAEIHRGSQAIVASYAAASARARHLFDDVRYESTIEAVEGDTATVTFIDYLIKAGGRAHRHRCRQAFTVSADGRITRIVHHELPGERESLAAFLRACGIED
jgi:uncharacterized protein (TIGR02246 family)